MSGRNQQLATPVISQVVASFVMRWRQPTFSVIAIIAFLGNLPTLNCACSAETTKSTSSETLPAQLTHNESFASSSNCQDCHPKQYASWHRSYHRTMTQVASAKNFVGKFDGTRIDSNGLDYQVFTRNEQFWARMPDPDE